MIKEDLKSILKTCVGKGVVWPQKTNKNKEIDELSKIK